MADRAFTGHAPQRVAVYGLAYGAGNRVLLVRDAASGKWFLPGGGVQYGEHPEQALRREFHEETGLTISAMTLRSVLSDVARLSPESAMLHSIRLVYDVELRGDELRFETDGSTDRVDWFTKEQARALSLQRFVSEVLFPG